MQWTRLCGVLGRPELAAVERFAAITDALTHRDELGAIFEPIFRTRTAAQWFATLDGAARAVRGLQ